MWRKNRQPNADGTFGVDLNRNYAYNYSPDNTGASLTAGSDIYRGTGAVSEPETDSHPRLVQPPMGSGLHRRGL